MRRHRARARRHRSGVMSVTLREAPHGVEDAWMSRRRVVGALAWAFVLVLVAPPLSALAQTAGPSATPTPLPSPTPKGATVEGEVSGGLGRGATLSFTVDATMPGGWEALHEVSIVVRSGDRELERLRYDIEDVQLLLGDHRIVVGTGGVATDEYLRVSGADVIVTTGAGNLSFKIDADVIRALPEDTRFQLGVVDDLLTPTSVTVSLADPPSRAITWGTVVALIAAALFAGGFVGNLFGSKRRPPARASVYSAVARRIESEREARGSSKG